MKVAVAFEQAISGQLNEALATLDALASPLARSAALLIVKNAKGWEPALTWFAEAGLTVDQLDADGKLALLAGYLELDRRESASLCAAQITDADLAAAPSLLALTATCELLSAIPKSLAIEALAHPPAMLLALPMSDDKQGIERRRRAVQLFERAAGEAQLLGCTNASNDAADRALALRLRDPDAHSEALSSLRDGLRDEAHSLRLAPLALRGGLEIDIDALESAISRRQLIAGGQSMEAALARLAIAQSKTTAGEFAQYIAEHEAELAPFVKAHFITSVEIQRLIEAGDVDNAARLIQRLADSATAEPPELERLRRLWDDATSNDVLGNRERRFEASGDLSDLADVVELLSTASVDKQVKYTKALFDATHDVNACELYGQALFRSGDYDSIAMLFGPYETLLQRSMKLKSVLAWSLYYLGELPRSGELLSLLRGAREDQQDRDLYVSLAITSGDWEVLSSFVEDEWAFRTNRSPRELVRAGQLAAIFNPPRMRPLIRAAAGAAPHDADVILACYVAAVSAGWEDETTAVWLDSAAKQSGPGGPIRRVSVDEIAREQPEWRRREVETAEKLGRGEIPLMVAARLTNGTLCDATLLAALQNEEEQDPRRRVPVYAYSGARAAVGVALGVVTMDPVALINAVLLDILVKIIAECKQLIIPHGTLKWLFAESGRLPYHQPSRVQAAVQLERLVAAGHVNRHVSSVALDEALALEVGRDLASQLADADADWGADTRTRSLLKNGA